MTPADRAITTPRPGGYARGAATAEAIVKAAHKVLIEEGAAQFTVRRIAAECGMKVGNVSYHFPRKEMLVQLMLDDMLESYDKVLDNEVRQPGLTAQERLRRVIALCLEDIAGMRTTRLFTELWAMANHNAVVAERVAQFYARVHGVICEYVSALNPALSAAETQTVALYISASMEGATPFLGYRKPWADRMPAFIAIAGKALVELACTITPDDIAGLGMPTRDPCDAR
ncbi:AcrR family transcriptional regulator [Novosphingobium capsulatum]|uniref:AcrR family transcriptional regulator n=1 Tax=Novosphingobium capsulatum TaxID=13688 RepID=A0ABU1MIV7_9SPHN|nr:MULTISPECIES: TetR family transcriptional regulator C-terminal domain-containing protein [Novosphingobium]KPF56627.1 TetR family transcriptional regulator [Novosphingobium sp. AAP1]MDR6510270.1 AcrR family transcriptional regulator [Novosphingobium capsulatum]WQD94393.1 TetR family transcriptional regulator [Novosphingobium capsulatum]